LPPAVPVQLAGWPLAPEQTQRRPAVERREMDLELAAGVTLKLRHVPAGQFVMGEAAGEPDERPLAAADVPAFWMGAFEVTNRQYRCFDPDHDSRYYAKRHILADDQGRPLDEPQQPVVRVSWQDAMAFCRWLSEKTGRPCSLPTEVQWEYACRAGSDTPLSFGGLDADFSPFANLADRRFAAGKQITGGLEQMMLEGALLSDGRFDDGAVVTAPVGGYRPNAWGLHDLHGNAAEWTRSTYRPYPSREDDGCEPADPPDRKVVRGGSFFDPPRRARSAYRLGYPAWQRVFNVGFRVVLDMDQG
jgi:formylglycine-generating enzyme required for sulfatase activity